MEKPAVIAPASGPTITAEEARATRRAQVAELYTDMTMSEIARELGFNTRTIWKDVRALGIAPRPAGRRAKYPPPPTDKTCAGCGKPITFAYPSDAIDTERQRKGVYCSHTCKADATRVHETPEPRECARPWCDNVFQPRGVDVAKGGGLYCSRECTRGQRGGALVVCPGCGTERWRPLYWIEAGHRFCGHRCWTLYRWQKGVGLQRRMKRAGGKARHRWLSRWAAQKKRRRRYTDEQRSRAVAMLQRGASIRQTANTTGLSKHQVEYLRGEELSH